MVWIGDRAPEAVVHEWLWQSQGLWVASRGFCSSCEMRVGAVGARCVRAASPTHALEHGVLSRSPSAAERRSPTSCNNEFCVCLSVSVCLSYHPGVCQVPQLSIAASDFVGIICGAC